MGDKECISGYTRTAWAKTCWLAFAVSGMARRNGVPCRWCPQTKEYERGWWWVLTSPSCHSPAVLFLLNLFFAPWRSQCSEGIHDFFCNGQVASVIAGLSGPRRGPGQSIWVWDGDAVNNANNCSVYNRFDKNNTINSDFNKNNIIIINRNWDSYG